MAFKFVFMGAKISIIVPVYNTEPYLPRCIDSILSQSFTDFELLLVDDGSTDGSGKICDAYAEKDSRIRVFHKENGGVSSARNLGLDEAKGDWVYFVDSDDELLPGGLATLGRSIQKDVDLIIGGYEQYDSHGVKVPSTIQTEFPLIRWSQQKTLLALFQGHSMYYFYLGYMWLFLFQNKIIQDNHLRFDTSILIKEDTLFVTKYLCRAMGATIFNTTPVYKYKMREDSAMGTLRNQYCPAYLTSMDAVIQMHSCIHQLPKVDKELSKAAKYEVVNRAYLILGHMRMYNRMDKDLESSLKHRAIKEVGLSYYIEYQYSRNKRRVKRHLKKILRVN